MTLGRLPLIASLVAVTGCDQIAEIQNPGIAACKTLIADHLKAPSSLKIISVHTQSVPITVTEWKRMNSELSGVITRASDVQKPGLSRIMITYDASNTFGVPIRSGQICDFPVKEVGDTPSDLAAKSAVNLVDVKRRPSDGANIECCTEAFAKVN